MTDMTHMERINNILDHKDYQSYLEKIAFHEKNRIFCGHNMVHFMDVARIGYIMILEDGAKISKEFIYAAALLHDIGRFLQYETGQPHELASGDLAPGILADCGYSTHESKEIVQAIIDHRNKSIKDQRTLSAYLYRADKASRACHSCPAEEECNWDRSKKNMTIHY